MMDRPRKKPQPYWRYSLNKCTKCVADRAINSLSFKSHMFPQRGVEMKLEIGLVSGILRGVIGYG